MMSSPPRYSLDEEENLISGSGKTRSAENHPLLLSASKDSAKADNAGGAFGADDAGASGSGSHAIDTSVDANGQRAIYGRLTTLYSFHPLYMVPGSTETCIGVLGKNRQVGLSSVISIRPHSIVRQYDNRVQICAAE